MSPTAKLAAFCASTSFEQLPDEVVHTVKRVVLDTLGTTLAAATLGDGCASLLALAGRVDGPTEATLIGQGRRVPATLAALVNGGLGHALNFDAGGSAGHLGSVIAAPLAAAQLRSLDGRSLITALAVGLEVMARLARSISRAANSQMPVDMILEGQLLGYFGAAAAAGRCLGLDAAQLHSAFGIALMQAAGSMQVVFDGDPPAKAIYAAFSNHGGLISATLAHHGLAAPIAAFEGRAGLFALHYKGQWEPAEFDDALGADYRLLNVVFKPWPSSGITHPFIEAAQRIGTVAPEDVRSIMIRGATRTRHWFEPEDTRRYPATGAAAANSVYYTVACALMRGNVTLADFMPDALKQAAPMTALMSHALDDTHGTSAIIEVSMRDGRTLVERVDTPLGTRARPMSDALVSKKFADCARFAPRPVDVDAIADQVWRLETLPTLAPLMDRL